jgi:hypothetical protein
MKIELLITCKPALIEEEKLTFFKSKLHQVLNENLNEVDEITAESFIELKYRRACEVVQIDADDGLPDDDETIDLPLEVEQRNILGITLNIPEETENLEQVIVDYCSQLTDMEEIVHVVKFEDDLLLKKNTQYFEEIFHLEMKLRRVITMIYLHQYSEDYFNLLREEISKPTSKVPPNADQMKESYENEFFHLLFSQYVNLNSRKLPSKAEELISLIKEKDSFESFQAELLRSPVTNEEDKDFLAGLKDKLDPIEKLRNCVAHNRTIPTRTLQNYNEAKRLLNQELDGYLERYKI